MNAQRGYSMILATASIALLALVLLAAARVHGDLRPSLRALQTRAAQELAAESLTARVAFLLLTEPIGPRSIVIGGPRELGAAVADAHDPHNELRLDGRFYQADFGRVHAFVAVQDEAGLINLNAPDEGSDSALLEGVGASAGAARSLSAALADYIDEDGLTRLAGAESAAYARLGLPPPANRQLTRRWQALEVAGWRTGLNAEQRARFWNLVSVNTQQQSLNLNTAPLAVLEAILGDRRAAEALATRRDAGELRDLEEVAALTAAPSLASGAGLALSPGSNFRLVVVFTDSRGVERSVERRIELALDAERPAYWRDEQRGHVGAARVQDGGDGLEQLPRNPATLAP